MRFRDPLDPLDRVRFSRSFLLPSSSCSLLSAPPALPYGAPLSPPRDALDPDPLDGVRPCTPLNAIPYGVAPLRPVTLWTVYAFVRP